MLFKVRGPAPPKDERLQNQMSIAQILTYRDTWTNAPYEGFSVERLLSSARIEKQKKSEVLKLVMSDNGFRVRDKTEMDESELELRRVQSALNKLTEQNFDVVGQEMLSHDLICNAAVLPGVVKIVFNKAVSEPVFSALYARLCARIANYERELVNESKNDPRILERLMSAQKQLMRDSYMPPVGDFVRFVLVSHCQKIYDEFRNQVSPKDPETAEQLRKQNMANIKFIGELYVKSLMTTRVIVSIASYALALGIEPGVTKTNVSDVDLEIAYNLFYVIGKKFDEMPKNTCADAVWRAFQKYADDTGFPKRIRFLVQNILDWRRSGWKPKDVAPLVSSSANTDTQSGANNLNAHGENQHIKSMHRVVSINNYQDHPSHHHHPHHHHQSPPHQHFQQARGQERGNSYTDLGQFADGANGAPFYQSWLPPPGVETLPESDGMSMSEEDKKLFLFAQPPKSLTPEVEMQICSIIRDAIISGDWSYAEDTLRELMPNEGNLMGITCAVFVITKKVTLSSSEDDRNLFFESLQNNLFTPVVSRGYSWFLADAIVKNAKEDVPRVFSRFIAAILATPSLDFLVVLREIMARTANYLDVLFPSLKSADEEWEEDFIEVWSNLVSAWSLERENDVELKNPIRILDCIAGVKQRTFMQDIAPDFVMELVSAGFITDEAISAWTAEKGNISKFKPFYEQIMQLFPGLE
ncbi:unnamed protein product [Phytomonas sp. Hart1]|nr:unnamed protein product [Phytomonas sp. Hart1]|eukprot:CCW70023.1 unnamed protein product [Phytomonas sp. isolate Hart1]